MTTDNKLQQSMNVPFASRLLAFAALTVLGLVVTGVLCLVTGRDSAAALRIDTVIQDLLVFVVPPVVAAIIACRLPARLLLLNGAGRAVWYVWMAVAFGVSLPAMNWLVEACRHLPWPEWVGQLEGDSEAVLWQMLGEPTVGSLVVGLLIVAVLAGFSEELYFRAGLQRLLQTRPMSAHAAVWITAVVFSAFHLQFYGFIPRLLLGAWFGYLALWSGTVWLPVAAHVLNNATVVVSQWLCRRGAVATSLDTLGADPSTGAGWALVAASAVATALAVWAVRQVTLQARAQTT